MKMRMRTSEEMEAYADGYNACNRLFRKYLEHEKTVEDAIKQMDIFVALVNGATNMVEVDDAD